MMVWQLFSQSITRLQNKNHHSDYYSTNLLLIVKTTVILSYFAFGSMNINTYVE